MITYRHILDFGINFMASSGLKVILSRADHEFEKGNPYACLYDKSCVIAEFSQKNMLKIDTILTSGKYKLTIFEKEPSSIRKFIVVDAGLKNKPISVSINSYPIMQTEER